MEVGVVEDRPLTLALPGGEEWRAMGTDERGPRVVTRGEMRVALTGRPPEDVWRPMVGWTATLRPFWLEAIERFAVVAAIPDERHDRYRTAAETAVERMDDWWHGRIKLVKARRQEIDGAISFIRNTALRDELRLLIQAPLARHVAGALRSCLHVATGNYSAAQAPGIAAGLVYTWAECRTLFPGDSSVLLQHVPPDQLADGPGNSSERFDRHDLVYAEAADRFGLRDAADAVYAEAAVIWDSFDTPLPWDPPADLWDRTYDGTYHDMYYDDLRAFHAR